jgi:hypothetical protein
MSESESEVVDVENLTDLKDSEEREEVRSESLPGRGA